MKKSMRKSINETDWIAFIPDKEENAIADIEFSGKRYTESGYVLETMSLKELLPKDLSVEELMLLCQVMPLGEKKKIHFTRDT